MLYILQYHDLKLCYSGEHLHWFKQQYEHLLAVRRHKNTPQAHVRKEQAQLIDGHEYQMN